ncbi:winged helix-turn-helix domain-containing protein [Rahnella selenatireducens]|uniref:winged helix-turn-helix domain-containing protein n=1 Tax=Rahnella selenatireducens TaxID=3389797 RepID=UPI003967E356
MKKEFILNDAVRFEPEKNSLTSIHAKPVQKIILHTPASECLRQLLLHNNQVVSQKFLFEHVWEKNGAFVTVNTLYQNIGSVRKGLKLAGIAEDVVTTLPKIGFRISVSIKESDCETAIIPSEVSEIETEGITENGMKASVKGGNNVHQPRFFVFAGVNKMFLLGFIIVVFVSVAMFNLYYQKYPTGRAYYAGYSSAGKVSGCELYSSYPGDKKSIELFSMLLSHRPIQCQPGSIAYMTVNRMYEVSSVIICDKAITENDAQCKSLLFSGVLNEK